MAPQFKKLTDCPENLCESIDWLIQVRYGNGQGDGLDELAKALKKLIEEAINNANMSLDNRQKQLECPTKSYNNSPSEKSNCQTLQDDITTKTKELKGLESESKDDNSKTKIDALKSHIKKAQDAKNDCAKTHSLSEEEREKGLSEIKQQRKIVENLKKFAESLDKNDESNLLNNLCTGLEKFLGFNSTSKGYDGTGIVYSDLDRLCDAVMGFLSGVLGAVKDDDAVETYDKHLDKTLNEVLEEVNKKIGTGRTGLVASVDAVKRWLEGYEREVKEKTENVKNELSRIIHNISGTYCTTVSRKADHKLEEQLAEWTAVIGNIELELIKLKENNVSTLDCNLRKNIDSEIIVIRKSVEMIKESAGKKALKDRVRTVDRTLNDEKRNLKSRFADEVLRIRTCIKDMITKKKTDFELVAGSLQDALRFLDGEFETNYRWNIIGHFEDIKREVARVHVNLSADKLALVQLVNDAQGHFNVLKEKVQGSNVRQPQNAGIMMNWLSIKEQIGLLVAGLTGANENKSGTLQQIVDKTKEWAAKFKIEGPKGFENVVEQWIDDILESQPVKGHIKKYVNYKDGSHIKNPDYKNASADGRELYPELNRKIRDDIKGKLGSLIKQAVQLAEVDHGETDIEKYVDAIQTGCHAFANDLGKNIENGGISAPTIANNIEKELEGKVVATNYNSNLREAVRLTLNQLVGVARGSGEAVESFAQASNMKNVHDAITKVKQIGTEFTDNQGQYGQYITTALTEVKHKVDALDGIFKSSDTAGSLLHKIREVQADAINTLERLVTEKSSSKDGVVIYKMRDDAAEKMEALRTNLRKKIYYIHELVTQTRNGIKNSIQTLLNTLNIAHHIVDAAIDASFLTVTNQIRTLFADAHKADLAALKTLVEEQKAEIERIIRSAKITGVMGLIRKMCKNEGTLREIENLVTSEKLSKPPTIGDFKTMASQFQNFADSYLDYTEEQAMTPGKINRLPNDQSERVKSIKGAVDAVLNYFAHHDENVRIHLVDHNSDKLLSDLLSSLNTLSPSFSSPSPLLTPLKAGLAKFTEQLGHAYVNRYSGRKFGDELVKKVTPKTPVAPGDPETPKEELTPEGRNCAKVCLTIVEMVHDGLEELKNKCSDKWSAKKINAVSSLGGFLKRNGYKVPTRDYVQDGELRNTGEMAGQDIVAKLIKTIDGAENNKHLAECKDEEVNELLDENKKAKPKSGFSVMAILKCLFKHIRQYNEVGHYVVLPKPRMPCNAYEMLVWFTGLMYNKAYAALFADGFANLLEKPTKTLGTDDAGLQSFDRKLSFLNAYPDKITYRNIEDIIEHICVHSHELLTTILGTGDEHTTYTSDLCNNSLGLYYPQKGEDCLHTILDILRRLFPVLSFLHSQCDNPASDVGWSQCLYGRDVMSSKWPCKEHSKGKSKCEAKCQPTCGPNDQPNCQPTSPLQSYLSDCLTGYLPHQVGSIGCGYKCGTCPSNKPGMPCLTPLGFRGFSCSTRRGGDISNVLRSLFTHPMIASIFCLSPQPPSTLPEHFGFALSLVRGWDSRTKPVLFEWVNESIEDRSIGLYEQSSVLTRALSNAYGCSQSNHDIQKHPHPVILGKPNDDKKYGDLSSLAMSIACSDQNAQCAPYLYALCTDQYDYLAKKQCKTYLSWAVYLPWTFWNYLNSLYNAFMDIYCQDWGCRTCLRADTCRRGQHGLVNDKTKAPNCHCSSIVECKGAMPTFYKYGFTFGAPAALNAENGKKTCTNFMRQLQNVLRSTYFTTLFEECDNFLWKIREPFIWLNVALWLLSLLYLIHIMVIRLDLLHIKSHLHSPSSHRIAAQSLLAAARVGKLRNVFYLQP